MQNGLLEVGCLCLGSRVTRAVVIPRAVSETDVGHIAATTVLPLHGINKRRVDDRAVGVEQTLFDTIDDDAIVGRGDLEVRVDDAVLGEWDVDLASRVRAG